MRNMELYERAGLGMLYVCANENGLWFSFNELMDVMEASANTRSKIFRFQIKEDEKCFMELDKHDGEGLRNEPFISSIAVHKLLINQLLKINEIRRWIIDIEDDFSILSIDSDFKFQPSTIAAFNLLREEVKQEPINQYAVKELMEIIDDEYDFVFQESMKLPEEYRDDYSIKDALADPFYDRFNPRVSGYQIAKEVDRGNISEEELNEFIKVINEKEELDIFKIEVNYYIDGSEHNKNRQSTCPTWLKDVVK